MSTNLFDPAPFTTTEGEGQFFTDSAAAVDRLQEIHQANMAYLVAQYVNACTAKIAGDQVPAVIRACYPELRFTVDEIGEIDPSLSHGFVDRPGIYATSITRPKMYRRYLIEQIDNLLRNHGGEVEIRVSDQPIPLRMCRGFNEASERVAQMLHDGSRDTDALDRSVAEGGEADRGVAGGGVADRGVAGGAPEAGGVGGRALTAADIAAVERCFTPIDSAFIDDTVADGEADFLNLPIKPLSLFTAPRVDLALQRLEHYTGAHASNLQRFVLFTNYQLHTDVFLNYAASLNNGPLLEGGSGVAGGSLLNDSPGSSGSFGAADSFGSSDRNTQSDGFLSDVPSYTELVCPGDLHFKVGEIPSADVCRQHAHAHQMPAYHLVREDGCGISIIDIGVGPSNAKTITDCLAVIRPHCWMMVGHCAGLDGRMRIGDMILANGYDRSDGVLDDLVPMEKPIPPIAEVQMAVTDALRRVSGLSGDELRKRLRTGTVLSTSDRNWEWRSQSDIYRELQKSTAIGVEMESATIATNGYRFRVPYGALLSVSDMPLHNQPKLPKSAKKFYQSSKEEHLMAAVRACEKMAEDPGQLHSRKLRRPVGEVAFR